MAWRRGGLARLMVEGVSDEVGSLGEESNAEEGKRVPREREWNQYVEAQVCASPVPHACFGVGPGRPNTRVSTRRGWIKAAVSCLPSLLPPRPTGPTLEAAHACAPAYIRGIRWYRMLLEFLFLLASEEQAVCSNIARNYCRRPFPDSEKGTSWVIVGDHTAPSS